MPDDTDKRQESGEESAPAAAPQPQVLADIGDAAGQAGAVVVGAAEQAGAAVAENVDAAAGTVVAAAENVTGTVATATSTAAQATAAVARAAEQATVQAALVAQQATVQAAQVTARQVTQATHTAQASLQQAGQRATVSPRKAVYRGRRFAVGFALGIMGLAFLGALAKRYHILPGDVGLTKAVQKLDGKPYDLLMQLVSELGWQVPSVISRATFSTVMWAAGFRMEGAATAGTFSADLVTMIIKEIVNRPRPTPDLVKRIHNLGETSFPSGHVVHYVTFYGFLFYLFFTHLKQGRGRNALLTLLAMLVLLVGPSRVYMGAHWPSDVAGAYLVGSLWLSVEIIAYLELKARFQMSTGWPFLVKRSSRLQ